MNTLDPYGLSYNDWEDPEVHDDCTGCTMCESWEGRTYQQIRVARIVAVNKRRMTEGGPATPAEAHRQDKAYWTDLYSLD